MISDGINGSASSYTVLYSDSITNSVCNRAVLNSTSCENGLCTHLFDTMTSECLISTDIAVSVVATNALGNGQSSAPVFHGIVATTPCMCMLLQTFVIG